MSSLNHDQEQFCSTAGVAMVRQRILALDRRRERLAFLILSGSFNPVHTQHLRALEMARQHVESVGWAVVGAFLAPSTDAYVEEKVGPHLLTLRQRIALCELAIQEHDWVSVCSQAELSSKVVCRMVRAELERSCFDALMGRELAGIEIMGSDTLVRIFGKILAQEVRAGDRESAQRGRVICSLPRPGSGNVKERSQIEAVVAPGFAGLGVKLMFVEPACSNPSLDALSSSAIRDLLLKRDWEALRSNGWLHPAVLAALQVD